MHASLRAGEMLSARGGLWQSFIFYGHVSGSFILSQRASLLVGFCTLFFVVFFFSLAFIFQCT